MYASIIFFLRWVTKQLPIFRSLGVIYDSILYAQKWFLERCIPNAKQASSTILPKSEHYFWERLLRFVELSPFSWSIDYEYKKSINFIAKSKYLFTYAQEQLSYIISMMM